jgi:hypothetical protein
MVTDTTCAKLVTAAFVAGVACGFLLNTRLRRWLN